MKKKSYKRLSRPGTWHPAPEALAKLASYRFGEEWDNNPSLKHFPFYKERSKDGEAAYCRKSLFIGRGRQVVKKKKIKLDPELHESADNLIRMQKEIRLELYDFISKGKVVARFSPSRQKRIELDSSYIDSLMHQHKSVFCAGFIKLAIQTSECYGAVFFDEKAIDTIHSEWKKNPSLSKFIDLNSNHEKLITEFVKDAPRFFENALSGRDDKWPRLTKENWINVFSNLIHGHSYSDSDAPEMKVAKSRLEKCVENVPTELKMMGGAPRQGETDLRLMVLEELEKVALAQHRSANPGMKTSEPKHPNEEPPLPG